MNWFSSIQSRLRALFDKSKLDAEMDEEMRSHIEMRTQANIREGMKPGAARAAAMKQFGWPETIKEDCRDRRGVRWMEDLARDVRFGLRMLSKSPGFTAISIVVLALGIGANATIFSIINSILLKPVNAHKSEQLVGVYQHDREKSGYFSLFSYADFVDLRRAQTALADLFAFRFTWVVLQDDFAKKVAADFVSANYFPTLGVTPRLGRWFLPDEETSGAAVAVLTDAFWKQLGADPAIIGRQLKLTRGVVTVVGVMPPGFSGAQVMSPALFLPVGLAPSLTANPGQVSSRILTDRADRSFMLMGRLKPGLTPANVNGMFAGLNEQYAIADPADPKPRTLICAAPSRFVFGSDPPHSIAGLGALAGFASGLAMLVLFVACLNLANMMLARGAARQKEIAIRLALGAGWRCILRQLLVEGILLALMGGVAGLLVSVWATSLLATLIYSGSGMPSDFPVFNLSPDFRVVAMLLALSGAATLVFALAPAWKLARLDFNSDLKRSAGDDSGTPRNRKFGGREFLAIGQMAFTLALLVVAVLFCRSAINVAGADPGFEFGSNFYVGIDASLTGYSPERAKELIRSATERLSGLPGVESVSSAMNIPFGSSHQVRGVQIGGAPPPSDGAQSLADGKQLWATYNVVGVNYFRTIGIPLDQGREFNLAENENAKSAPVAIVSRHLAELLWPGRDVLGRALQFPALAPGLSPTVMTVVGIAPDVQWDLFEKDGKGQIYVPFGQDFTTEQKLHVRVKPGVDPTGLMAAARSELRKMDPLIPLTEIKTLAAFHRDGPWVRVTRLGSVLFGAFGGLAMLLSLLGVYGLKAYSVARRTREIGIRIALGASRRDVMSMVLREAFWLAAAGLGLGFALALAAGRVSARFLYHVPAWDQATLIIIPPVLLAAVIFACWFPARRAARVDPIVALRHE